MVPRVNWDLPIHYTVLLVIFISISMVFSAIWAAALTPNEVTDASLGSVIIPSWENTSLIREYPSEVGKEGPTQQTAHGRFSYSVGIQLLGRVLAGASSASTVDRGVRVHSKMDRSRYSYIGRSYGIGASAGLADQDIENEKLALGYKYQEIGYKASVQCIYNQTSDFRLHDPLTDGPTFTALGKLPDSDNGGEWSTYIGHTKRTVVAIGVAHFPENMGPVARPRKYLALAAGKNYDFLDKAQCEIDFTPTKFNVTVNVRGRNITVSPTDDTDVEDIDPSRYLKGVLLRQFELIANDETNLYVSMVGQALNASITDYRTSIEAVGNPENLTEEDISLRGLENSITVMTDDMLGAYAAAQLMISNFKQETGAEIRFSALAIGEPKYCIAAFALNGLVLLIFALEASRTKWWRGLPDFNISDVRHLIIAASEGGSGLGKAGFESKDNLGSLQVKCGNPSAGRFAIVLDGDVRKSARVSMRMEI